jgi:DNA sulfur modification protein DndE
MKPFVETVRISQKGRDNLATLKRTTGIDNWNTLCRGALCTSLRESTAPPKYPSSPGEKPIEIPWRIFAGDHSDLFISLTKLHACRHKIDTSDDKQLTQFLLNHVHRGLSYLCSGDETVKIDVLFSRWLSKGLGS